MEEIRELEMAQDSAVEGLKPVILNLGREQYIPILNLQRNLNHLRNENLVGNVLIFVEHEDVYTSGIHRNPSEVLSDNIEPIEVERGGSLTYHGPGQLVVYFIYNLKEAGINVRDLIKTVQGAISRTLSGYGIQSEGRLHGETGVWVSDRKICSIGFALKGFTTLHGIAVNVNTDLSKFDLIMPCGMNPAVMTSVNHELRREIEIESFRYVLMGELLSALRIYDYIRFNSMEKFREFSMSNRLGLFPEELL